jgi:hypothetical protein
MATLAVMTGARSNMAVAAFRVAFMRQPMPGQLVRRLLMPVVVRVVRAERLERAAHGLVAERVPAEQAHARAAHGPEQEERVRVAHVPAVQVHVPVEQGHVLAAHRRRVRVERALGLAERRHVPAEPVHVPVEHQRHVPAEQARVQVEVLQPVLRVVELVPLVVEVVQRVVEVVRRVAELVPQVVEAVRQPRHVPHQPPVAEEAVLTTSKRSANGDYEVQVVPI